MPFPIKTRASEYQQIFVLSIAIIILMHQQKFYLTVTEDKEHNRNSNTTNSTEDDAPLLQTLTLNSSSFNNCHVRLLLATNQQKVSKKFNKSAVAWIQMQCLIKGLSMEAGLLAVTLYYCFCRVRKIQKSELEPLLISCVTIASKLYNGPILSIKDGLALVNTAYPTGKIAKYEQELMQCVNFNLHLHTNFTNFQEEYGESNIYYPTCFLLELLLLKDISVLYEPRKFESLIVITRALLSSEFQLNKSETSGQIEVEFDQEIWANICEIMDKNSPEALIGKYRSSFDVDHFIQMIKSI